MSAPVGPAYVTPWPFGDGQPSDDVTILFTTDLSAAGIYNYGSYVGSCGQPTPNNDAAFASMFADMGPKTAPGIVGGTVWLPPCSFTVTATGTGLSLPDQIIIQGLASGAGNQANLFINEGTGNGDTLWHFNPPNHTEGGISVRNVGFRWNSPTNVNDMCLNLETWGARIQECVFTDCPTAVGFDGVGAGLGLGCTMERCTIRYGVHSVCPNNAVMVIMSGEQAQILGGIFNQNPFINGGPNGVTGLGWGGGLAGSEHQIVQGVHFADFQYGIDFSNRQGLVALVGGVQIFTLADCELDNYSQALNLSSHQVTSGNFSNIISGNIRGNTFDKSRQSQNDSNPIILIDTLNEIGGSNANITAIDFVANKVYSNVTYVAGQHPGDPPKVAGIAADNQYGVEIRGGSNLRFIGGKIGQMGNNGTNTGGVWSDGSANVCINGGVTGGGPGTTNFTSVVLGPKYGSQGTFGGGATGAGPSQYGVLIKGHFVNGPVIFNNCDLSGFSGTGQAAVHVDVAGGAVVGNGCLYFNNCPGYNDQDTNILAGGTIPIGTPFAAATAANPAGSGGIGGGLNYYGPHLFTGVSNGGTLSINGHAAQALLVGQLIVLPLGPYDTMQFSIAPTNPIWRGR